MVSFFVRPKSVPFKYMFEIPVYSGLKPQPNSNSDEILPFIKNVPLVCEVTPLRIFKRVDLPLPFFPIIPIDSPLYAPKEILFNAALLSLSDENKPLMLSQRGLL